MINDDILILYYYRDGLSVTERARVQAELVEDDDLRARYERLCHDLESFGPVELELPAPDAVTRWHDSIDRAAGLERQRAMPRKGGLRLPSFTASFTHSFTWSAAVAAALVGGIGIGSFLSGGGVPEPSFDGGYGGTVSAEAPARPDAFGRGLLVHLRETRRDLAGLPIDAGPERAALITQMIQQNRMFEQAAVQNGAQDLARVLRAFEPILVQLAGDEISPGDTEALQAQLAFELNVMLTKFGPKVSEVTGPI